MLLANNLVAILKIRKAGELFNFQTELSTSLLNSVSVRINLCLSLGIQRTVSSWFGRSNLSTSSWLGERVAILALFCHCWLETSGNHCSRRDLPRFPTEKTAIGKNLVLSRVFAKVWSSQDNCCYGRDLKWGRVGAEWGGAAISARSAKLW